MPENHPFHWPCPVLILLFLQRFLFLQHFMFLHCFQCLLYARPASLSRLPLSLFSSVPLNLLHYHVWISASGYQLHPAQRIPWLCLQPLCPSLHLEVPLVSHGLFGPSSPPMSPSLAASSLLVIPRVPSIKSSPGSSCLRLCPGASSWLASGPPPTKGTTEATWYSRISLVNCCNWSIWMEWPTLTCSGGLDLLRYLKLTAVIHRQRNTCLQSTIQEIHKFLSFRSCNKQPRISTI